MTLIEAHEKTQKTARDIATKNGHKITWGNTFTANGTHAGIIGNCTKCGQLLSVETKYRPILEKCEGKIGGTLIINACEGKK